MKRWWSGLVALVVVGCTMPGSNESPASITPGMGQLVVKLVPEAGRTLVGSAWASSVADAYELVLAGGTTKTFPLGSGVGQVLAVEPGTYRATVLAGVKRSSGSTTAYLVGSGTLESVVIVEGRRTVVDFLLKSIDVGWGSSGAAYWKGAWTARALGASRNPWVGASLGGASTSQRLRFRSADLWGGYKETVVTGSPDQWSCEAGATVPGSGGGFTVELVGSVILLANGEGQWLSTAGVTSLSWLWPSRPDLADNHPLVGLTTYAVSAQAPPTGVEVNLAWE